MIGQMLDMGIDDYQLFWLKLDSAEATQSGAKKSGLGLDKKTWSTEV